MIEIYELVYDFIQSMQVAGQVCMQVYFHFAQNFV